MKRGFLLSVPKKKSNTSSQLSGLPPDEPLAAGNHLAALSSSNCDVALEQKIPPSLPSNPGGTNSLPAAFFDDSNVVIEPITFSSPRRSHQSNMMVVEESKTPDDNGTLQFPDTFQNALDDVHYYDIPTINYKLAGVPMVALHTDYYGRRKLIDSKTCNFSDLYFTWDDGNPKAHIKRFTAVFICPVTAEIFPAGRFSSKFTKPTTEFYKHPNRKDAMEEEGTETNNSIQFWWYSKKKNAEHGAAARAFDCKSFRLRQEAYEQEKQRLGGQEPHNFRAAAAYGEDTPYLEKDAMTELPNFVPEDIRRVIGIRQEVIRAQNKVEQEEQKREKEEEQEKARETDDEAAWHNPKQ